MASENPGSLHLTIDGMSCGHCVAAVRAALAAVAGLQVVDAQVGAATVTTDGRPATLAAALAALDDAGFSARLAGPAEKNT